MQQQGTWGGSVGPPVIFPTGGVMPLAQTGAPLGAQQQGGGMGGAGTAPGARGRREAAPFIPAKVFLGGISNDTNEESLQAYCGQWGELADVHVMHGKGYAFVTFGSVPTAQAFLEHREHYIDGRRVDAKAAVPRDQGGGKLTRKMFVGGIGEVSDAEFRSHFAPFGTITDCVVLRKPDGGSRGFGFVTFDDEMSVEKCLVMEHHLAGRRVDVKRAINKDAEGGGGTGPGTGGGAAGGRGGPTGGMGMQQAGGSSADKTQDWACAECGTTNYGWRHTCSRCKTRRVGAPGGSGGPTAGAGSMGAGGASAAGGMTVMAGMQPGSIITPAAMLNAGIIPAHLMAGMLQQMPGGMQGMPAMQGMQGNLAGMGGMTLPAGMAMPMGAMASMMGMAGMPGMDGTGMGATGLAGGMMGMPGMQALLPGMLNPAALAGMSGMAGMPGMAGAGGVGAGTAGASGGGAGSSYGGYGVPTGGTASVYGGYSTASTGGAAGAGNDAAYTVGDSGAAYGRAPAGRPGVGAANTQQRFRPY